MKQTEKAIESTPFKPTHPGTLLNDELEARGIKQKEFALEIDVLPTYLNEIIKGKRSITADVAVLLESVLDISADYWLRFQSQFDLQESRLKEKVIERRNKILVYKDLKNHVAIPFLKRLGYLNWGLDENIEWIFALSKRSKLLPELINEDIQVRHEDLLRKSDKLESDNKNVNTWIAVVKYEAEKISVPAYDERKIEMLGSRLQSIFFSNSDVIKCTTELLNSFGIKFLIVEKPKEKCPIDGIAFWSGKNPTIALSLRHKRIDNFAFTLMHEIGHIVLHLNGNYTAEFEESKNDLTSFAELEADNYSKENLIPKHLWESINNLQLHEDEPILRLSKEHKIHPAIILGRLCKDNNNFKVKTAIDKSLK